MKIKLQNPSKLKTKAFESKPKKVNIIEEHYKGMPEFKQEDKKPFKQVLVSFTDAEGMHKFSKLIGQKILKDTRSVWYPPVPNTPLMDKRWVDSDTKTPKKLDKKKPKKK